MMRNMTGRTYRTAFIQAVVVGLFVLSLPSLSSMGETQTNLQAAVNETAVLIRIENPTDENLGMHYWFGDFSPQHEKRYIWKVHYLDEGYWKIRGLAGIPVLETSGLAGDFAVGYEAYSLFNWTPDYEETFTAPPGESHLLVSTYKLNGEFLIQGDDRLSFELIQEDAEMHRYRFHQVSGDWENATYINSAGAGIFWGDTKEEIRYPYNAMLFSVDPGALPGAFRLFGPEGRVCAGEKFYAGRETSQGIYDIDAFSMASPGAASHMVFWEILDVPLQASSGPSQTCV